MRIRLKHVLVALIALVLLALAYSPLLRAGLLVGDYRALLDPGALSMKPLAALSLEASLQLWGFPGERDGVALALRLEHIGYLLIAGVGLGYFVRRLLLPWSGSEPSKAAGRAAALLLALHPLVIWSVANVDARGELLGFGLSTWACFCFLRGRQDQRFGAMALSFVLAIAAGFCSWISLMVPCLLAVCDLISTHRYRPLRTRLRTALTTLVLYSAAVLVQAGVALGMGQDAGFGRLLGSLGHWTSWPGARRALAHAAERIGLLVLPSNPEVLGALGLLIAGVAFMLAMQPALLAARSAPRLWGWLLVGMSLALMASIAMSLDVEVGANQLAGAVYMLPSIAVISAGLGLGATALSGPHRPYMAWVVVIAYATLAHANARPWMRASQQLWQLRQELHAPLQEHPGLRTVVLDVPVSIQGLQVVGERIGVLLDARLRGAPRSTITEDKGSLALTSQEFLSLLFEPEFRAWLGEECLIVHPARRLAPDPDSGAASTRAFSLWHPQESSKGAREWLQTLQSPNLDLAPQEEAALWVSAPGSLAPGEEPSLGWLTQASPPLLPQEQRGTWRRTEAGTEAWFDLGSSLSWRLGGRVRRLLFASGLQTIERAGVQRELPGLGAPSLRISGSDLELSGVVLPEGFGQGELRLQWLDLASFQARPLALEPGDSSNYLSRGRAPELQRALGAGHPLAWVLEYSIQGHSIARTRGRF